MKRDMKDNISVEKEKIRLCENEINGHKNRIKEFEEKFLEEKVSSNNSKDKLEMCNKNFMSMKKELDSTLE